MHIAVSIKRINVAIAERYARNMNVNDKKYNSLERN